MSERVLSDSIVETNTTTVDYLERYRGEWMEWINGDVIKMSAASSRHVLISSYFLILLQAYFDEQPIGKVMPAPFGLRIDAAKSIREPDLQIVLNTNTGELTDSHLVGAADVCIEIVSQESIQRDYEIKFREYEQGGITEYWIIDPLKEISRFYRLDQNGKYNLFALDEQHIYQTALLPQLKVQVSNFWQEPLPSPKQIVREVEAMFRDSH